MEGARAARPMTSIGIQISILAIPVLLNCGGSPTLHSRVGSESGDDGTPGVAAEQLAVVRRVVLGVRLFEDTSLS